MSERRVIQDDPACLDLMRRFIPERPELWDEDIARRDDVSGSRGSGT